MELERLIIICPSIEIACHELNLENFCVGPIRQTRPFLKSCFVFFRNVMLELLQVIEHEDAEKFVFYNEWKQATKPTWVAIGLKAESLALSLDQFKKLDIVVDEEFIHHDNSLTKGFKHKSYLLSGKWNGRAVYVTEYDNEFLKKRNTENCVNLKQKESYSILIPSFCLAEIASKPENLKATTLNLKIIYRYEFRETTFSV